MLNNLLNTLAFGSTIQQNGKPYTVIMRLTDRLFVVKEPESILPAPLLLAQADIQMKPPVGMPGPPVAGPSVNQNKERAEVVKKVPDSDQPEVRGEKTVDKAENE